jgi:Fe-S cluster biogenesis protein NfuA
MSDMALSDFIEHRPHFGIIASMTGGAVSLIGFLQEASVVIGFLGACFGLAAGYFTWRIKRRHWQRILDKENEHDS